MCQQPIYCQYLGNGNLMDGDIAVSLQAPKISVGLEDRLVVQHLLPQRTAILSEQLVLLSKEFFRGPDPPGKDPVEKTIVSPNHAPIAARRPPQPPPRREILLGGHGGRIAQISIKTCRSARPGSQRPLSPVCLGSQSTSMKRALWPETFSKALASSA